MIRSPHKMPVRTSEPSLLDMLVAMPPPLDVSEVKALQAALEEKLQELHGLIAYVQSLKMPVPGVDFEVPTAPTIQEIITQVRPLLPQPEQGKTPTKEELVALIKPLIPEPIPGKDGKPGKNAKELQPVAVVEKLKEEKLQIEHIDGLPETLEQIRREKSVGYLHGGGVPSLSAGTGVTLTPKNDGGFTVASSVTGLSIIAIAGTIDDSNVTFTAPSTPTLLNINGAFYKQAGGAITWSIAAGTITLSSPVGTNGSIFGI